MFTKLASVLAFFGGGGLLLSNGPTEVVFVNKNNELLADWKSESTIGGSVSEPECNFYDDSVVFSADLCSHLAISRSSSTPLRASTRAMACGALFGAECILSPEVGFALPAAFLYSHQDSTMNTIVAPKLLQHDSEIVHVRVAPPSGDGLLDTFTTQFNSTISVEYMDGVSKQLITAIFKDDDAFCIQLLRRSYEELCWEKLD